MIAGPAGLSGALPRALILLAVATMVLVATEFIVVGLLPILARDLDITLAQTGSLVSAFALAAGLLGPPLTLALSSQPPRWVLVGALLVTAVGNVATILVPSYPMMLAARIAQGAALPLFISVGTATIFAMAHAGDAPKMLARANIGFVLGIIVALPAGVALAEGGAWSQSLLVLGLMAFAAAALVGAAYPAIVEMKSPSVHRQAAILLKPLFASHVLLSVAAFAATFAAYTYLAAWLEGVAGLSVRNIALSLGGFGLAGLVGNAFAAHLAKAAPVGATVAVTAIVAIAAIGLSTAHTTTIALVGLLAIWGIAHTASVTLAQIRVTLAGGSAPAFAMAINIASANLGIALGAWAGGFVVDRFGLNAIGWGAAALGVAVTACAIVTHRLGQAKLSAAGTSGNRF